MEAQGNHPSTSPNGANLLPSGANREANTSNQSGQVDALAIGIHRNLYIDYHRWASDEEEDTLTKLAQALQVTEKELTLEEINGRQVVIAPYHDEQGLRNILETSPKLGNCLVQNEDVDMEGKSRHRKTAIKVRQCRANTNIEDLLAINDLAGWWGKLQPPRENGKSTTAILTAPTEREAQELLEIGYLLDNGNVLAVIPLDSTIEEENKRTVLLVGVNKLQQHLKSNGKKLTELSLLRTLNGAGFRAQATKMIELPGERVGHSAFVLMKTLESTDNLRPLKDTESGLILRWAKLVNKSNICEKCLEWEGHDSKCPKHPSNSHRFASAIGTAKRAAEKEDIMKKMWKRPK